jgi:hypothetical protein
MRPRRAAARHSLPRASPCPLTVSAAVARDVTGRDGSGRGIRPGRRACASLCFAVSAEDPAREPGRLAQRESASFTPRRSLVRSQYRPPEAAGPLRDLEADEVSKALIKLLATRSTRTIRDTRASLVRIITYAQARGLVGRNVAALLKAPKRQAPGRPSKSLTVAQARAVLKAAEADRLNAYFVLSLVTGVRTEEARALRWDHVDLDRPTPSMAVWRSVRAGGDVKTQKVQAHAGAG